MTRKHSRIAVRLALIALCAALLLGAAAQAESLNPVVHLGTWLPTQSEEAYFGTWAYDRAVNEDGELTFDGISADTYQLTIGPGWYQESIMGQLSLYPTTHVNSMLMCVYDDGSGAPAYFRLFLDEEGRLYTPMGQQPDAFTIYFTRLDDAPGTPRGEESDDEVVGDWAGPAPAGAALEPAGAVGELTFQPNGVVKFESDKNYCFGMWSRDGDAVEAAWVHYASDRWTLADGALTDEADGAAYARETAE